MKEMLFEVAFMPHDVKENSKSVCVLIDVIRASTTMTKLLEKGCSEIVLTSNEQQTMNENPSFATDGTLICAEQLSGDAAEGADFSPSLMAVEKADVQGRRVVMRTTNGTVGIHTLKNRNIEHILIGCMNNAYAVMQGAVSLASELNVGIMIVSAGRENTRVAALDDAYCAAQLLSIGMQNALENGISSIVADSGIIVNSLLSTYTEAFDAFSQSASGAVMRRIDCEDDVFTCSRTDTTDVVGKVYFEDHKICVLKINQLVNC